MAEIASIAPFAEVGKFEVEPTQLTGADTLIYKTNVKQTLFIENKSASPVTIVIDGDGVTTVALPGQGGETNNAAGYSIAIAAGEIWALALMQIRNFLKGSVAVTGGAANVFAWIVES